MFKKLKDKIAEEVKQSPARFQEIINSAQAAVSSAGSSSTDENPTQSENSSSANENFFSLTEEDTPQNSPIKTIAANNSFTSSREAVSVDLHSPFAHNVTSSVSSSSVNNGTQRTRKLSNSSMASDVSFRLPHYDSQPIYHLQSDWESASEAEDSGVSAAGAKLDQISKEQVYQAYRTSIDKYQKYRGRYLELAQKYRELEKDNAKARQVLVETQDKALRRISELREQCQLEQQAKAHLESALRLEMDDLVCVNQTLRTKLELVGESSNGAINGSSSEEKSLINLSNDDESSNEPREIINRLERELEEYKQKFDEECSRSQLIEKNISKLTSQLEASQKEIQEPRFVEHTAAMTESKTTRHEDEIEKLQAEITALKKNENEITQELNTLSEKLKTQNQILESLAQEKLKLEVRFEEASEEKNLVKSELNEMKNKIEKVNLKFNELSEEKASIQVQNAQLTHEIKSFKDEINELQRQKSLLTEEIKSIKIINESSVSQEVLSLQESMKCTVAKLETTIADPTRDFNKTIAEKSTEIEALTSANREMSSRLLELKKDEAILSSDRDACRSKIDLLKNEKRDHEKTLEREIREKNELKTQVTNILQEIGRLEEQLKEVRSSHSSMQSEKQKLEEKVERIQRQHHEAKSKLEKDQTQKWQTKMKELEVKLQNIQCENSQLAEKNCFLKEESTRRNADELKRIQANLSDSQDSLRRENDHLLENVIKMEEKVATLEEQLKQCTGDHAKLFDEKELLDHQYRSLQDLNEATEKEKLCLIEDYNNLQQELNSSKGLVTQLESEKMNLTECCDNLRVVVENIKKENDAMMKTRDELQKSFDNMKCEFDKLNAIKKKCEEQTEALRNENKNLNARNKSLTNEFELLNQKNVSTLGELENSLQQVKLVKASLKNSVENSKELKIQNEALLVQTRDLEAELSQAREVQTEMNEKIAKNLDNEKIYDEKIKELSLAAAEKETQVKTLQELELAISTTNRELESLNKDLLKKINALENQINMQCDYQQIKAENVSLSKQKSDLLKQLQQVNVEKSDLLSSISSLEAKINQYQMETSKEDVEQMRTKITSLENQLKGTTSDFEDMKNENLKIKSENMTLENSTQQMQGKIEELLKNQGEFDEIKNQNILLSGQHKNNESEIQSLKNSLQAMETDQLRLQKEIESSRSTIKDLNDQLEAFKKEESVESINVQASSDRIDALTAENKTLQESKQELLEKLENIEKLNEENLNEAFDELKLKYDQLIKENANKISSNDELSSVKAERDEISDRLRKIMSEVEDVSSKNLFLEQKVENFLILEQSNERLRLTNEKLSRQLDETLVSMHHNEGIQANTEFEYLRNILFQYLSGHVNANGGTLVKVIAAVLKFTPQQTQLVLDKEQQRHTLVGSINNLL